jgi:hypothetical protein
MNQFSSEILSLSEILIPNSLLIGVKETGLYIKCPSLILEQVQGQDAFHGTNY